jgi:hypothetical protein
LHVRTAECILERRAGLGEDRGRSSLRLGCLGLERGAVNKSSCV